MENILHERDTLKDIVKALELGKVTFLPGSRQTGKTSLMKLTLDYFSNCGYTCFFMDMEDARNLPVFESLLFKKNPYLENLKAKNFAPSEFIIDNVERNLYNPFIVPI